MKKLSIMLAVVAVWLLMTNYIATVAEQEIKALFVESDHGEPLSIELQSYQRHFFSSTAITKLTVSDDETGDLSLIIISTIYHLPYQALIKNSIKLLDEALNKKAESYFSTTQWITSEERINLFSELTGELTIVAGSYKSDNESLSTKPVMVDYQVDLKTKKGYFNLNWAGLSATTNTTKVDLQALQLSSYISLLTKQSDYNYRLKIAGISIQQDKQKSLLEGVLLKGRSQQGSKEETLDTSNELVIDSYQFNTNSKQSFTDNRIKLALTGLYQPAFELLSSGSDDNQEIENALTELVKHGAQLKLSQLSSKTPWGEVDGKLDLTLEQGAALTDIAINPYILFDYMSGDVSLVLPVNLLDEPTIAESLQMGLMTGFLEKNEQTLNLKTSFQQGELTVNGRVIPL
ncbi:MAG: YdgA family protein [Psychromonas sp.]|nr:YdgA family protein [Psychromonas sp.]